MLNLKKIVTLLVLIASFVACKKIAVENGGNTLLFKQSINNIKKNEPVSLTFGNDSSSANVLWTITPNNNVTMQTIANNTAASFCQYWILFIA